MRKKKFEISVFFSSTMYTQCTQHTSIVITLKRFAYRT